MFGGFIENVVSSEVIVFGGKNISKIKMYSTLSYLSNDQFIMLKLFNKDCLINNI